MPLLTNAWCHSIKVYLFIVCSVKDINAQEYLHHVLFGFSFWCLPVCYTIFFVAHMNFPPIHFSVDHLTKKKHYIELLVYKEVYETRPH